MSKKGAPFTKREKRLLEEKGLNWEEIVDVSSGKTASQELHKIRKELEDQRISWKKKKEQGLIKKFLSMSFL